MSYLDIGARQSYGLSIGARQASGAVPATVSPPVATITIAALLPTVEGDLAVKQIQIK